MFRRAGPSFPRSTAYGTHAPRRRPDCPPGASGVRTHPRSTVRFWPCAHTRAVAAARYCRLRAYVQGRAEPRAQEPCQARAPAHRQYAPRARIDCLLTQAAHIRGRSVDVRAALFRQASGRAGGRAQAYNGRLSRARGPHAPGTVRGCRRSLCRLCVTSRQPRTPPHPPHHLAPQPTRISNTAPDAAVVAPSWRSPTQPPVVRRGARPLPSVLQPRLRQGLRARPVRPNHRTRLLLTSLKIRLSNFVASLFLTFLAPPGPLLSVQCGLASTHFDRWSMELVGEMSLGLSAC
jgi:hypothetical protein